MRLKRTNKTLINPFSSTKIAWAILFIMIFTAFLPMASSFEFDNCKQYDEETRTATIINAFCLGDVIANITLLSPDVVHVIPGEERKVAWFRIDNFQDYAGEDAFGVIDVYDLKDDSSPLNKNFKYKKMQLEEIEYSYYGTICEGTGDYYENGTEIPECHEEEIEDSYYVEEWSAFNKNHLLEVGLYTLGLFTEVERGEHAEWIPTFFGVEIDEWAEWSDTFESGLATAWTFEEASGDLLDVALERNNATTNMTTGYHATGINDYGWDFEADSQHYANLTMFQGEAPGLTVNVWIKPESLPANANVLGIGTEGNAQTLQLTIQSDGDFFCKFHDNTGAAATATASGRIVNGIWTMITCRSDPVTDVTSIYVNGTWIGNGTSGAAIDMNGGWAWLIGNSISENIPYDGIMDEMYVWNESISDSIIADLYDSGAGTFYEEITPLNLSVSLDSPPDSDSTTNTTYKFFSADYAVVNGNLTNATLNVWYSNSTLFRQNSTTITGLTNSTNLSLSNFNYDNGYIWNYYACAVNNTNGYICNWSASNRTFDITRFTFTESSQGYVTDTAETSQEQFNITLVTSPELTYKAVFVYNNTRYTSPTQTGSGSQINFSRTIDIPLSTKSRTENRTFYWELNLTNSTGSSYYNSTIKSHNVYYANLSFCKNATNIPYINFTFKNETTAEEIITAYISSSWSYWIGDGSLTRTLSFSNTSENKGYAFCFEPEYESVNVNLSLDYNNGESQQRTYTLEESLLTNITTSTTLYLLPTSAGLYQKFAVVDSNGDPLSQVLATITRTLGGSTVTVGSSLTDSSGFVIFFLNPDATYNAVFSKTGYSDNSFSFVPTTETRTVIMGGGGIEGVGNGTEIMGNTTYQILPINSTLLNNTDYTFAFNVTSSQTVTLISMNITNKSGTQLGFQSNAGKGYISETINTVNNTILIGYFIIETDTESISVTKIWTVGDFFEGDYSIFKQFTLFNDYEFKDFWKILIALGFIIGIMIFLSSGELIETNESKIVVMILLVWAFSIIGWFDTGISVTTTNTVAKELGQFSSQYGIAILTTCAGAFFLLRRVFT